MAASAWSLFGSYSSRAFIVIALLYIDEWNLGYFFLCMSLSQVPGRHIMLRDLLTQKFMH
jgi:tellurite resistance protein TehA-like permease